MRGVLFNCHTQLKEWAEEEEDVQVLTILQIAEQYATGVAHVVGIISQIKQALVGCEQNPDLSFMTVHKAKGSEHANVVLADDFRVPLRDEADMGEADFPFNDVNSPFWREELNILYVAVTRAKKTMWHSPDTWRLMLRLRGDPELANPEVANHNVYREQNERRWQDFTMDLPRVVSVETVPWPRGCDDDNVLALDGLMQASEIAQQVRQWRKRLHPDKFFSKYVQESPPT